VHFHSFSGSIASGSYGNDIKRLINPMNVLSVAVGCEGAVRTSLRFRLREREAHASTNYDS